MMEALKESKCCNAQAVTSRKFGAGYYECLKCGANPCELIITGEGNFTAPPTKKMGAKELLDSIMSHKIILRNDIELYGDRLVEEAKQQLPVDVKDGLPDKKGREWATSAMCIVFHGIKDKPEVKACYYNFEDRCWYTHWLEKINHVTHWMYYLNPQK